MASASAPRRHGIVIAGAGLAGAAAALCLQRQGHAVTLLEKAVCPGWRPGETLAPEANDLLRRLGLHASIGNGGHLRCPGMLSSWGSPTLSSTSFITSPHGNGWQVERAVLEQACLDGAAGYGATIVRSAPVQRVARTVAGWEVTTPQGIFYGTFLIDATGRAANVMRQAGVRQIAYDRLVSVYARAGGGDPALADARTLIEATPDGWWYAALTPSGQTTVAFQTDVDLLRAHAWRNIAWFNAALDRTEHLRRLGIADGWAIRQGPALTSARTVRLAQFAGPGWMAIGDAAIARDPLSGQGMMRALDSGVAAADAIESGGAQLYADKLESDWVDYLAVRRHIYGSERRWPEQPFWRDRFSALHAAD